MRTWYLLALLGIGISTTSLVAKNKGTIVDPKRPAKSRTFDFIYEANVPGLKPGQPVRIWVPVPSSNDDQHVRIVSTKGPGKKSLATEPEYNNRVLYFEGKADEEGKATVRAVYRVTRRELLGARSESTALTPNSFARLLRADKKVPIQGKPLALLEGKRLPSDDLAAARVLYDVVNEHMRYSKEGEGWGKGDSVWACANGYGNCTDFHSLFISLARSQKIPAKFEIGFPLPEKRGEGTIAGYHCWAKFLAPKKGWVGIDISEADKLPKMAEYYFGNLTENRVCFSMGRDITLEPKQAGPPLNFFIYPHVEVDGKVYPQEKIQRKFSYRDVVPQKGE